MNAADPFIGGVSEIVFRGLSIGGRNFFSFNFFFINKNRAFDRLCMQNVWPQKAALALLSMIFLTIA